MEISSQWTFVHLIFTGQFRVLTSILSEALTHEEATGLSQKADQIGPRIGELSKAKCLPPKVTKGHLWAIPDSHNLREPGQGQLSQEKREYSHHTSTDANG